MKMKELEQRFPHQCRESRTRLPSILNALIKSVKHVLVQSELWRLLSWPDLADPAALKHKSRLVLGSVTNKLSSARRALRNLKPSPRDILSAEEAISKHDFDASASTHPLRPPLPPISGLCAR